MGINNSQLFNNSDDAKYSNKVRIATSITNNSSITSQNYTPNLHTDDLDFTLHLNRSSPQSPPYQGWYYKSSTGQYFTGKEPNISPSHTNQLAPNLNTGFVTGPNNTYYYPSDLTLYKSEESTTEEPTVYNGESGLQEPTHLNYCVGHMVRFFSKLLNSNTYQEINYEQYKKILGGGNLKYEVRAIKWAISGYMIEECFQQNKMSIACVEKGLYPNIIITETQKQTPYIATSQNIFSYNSIKTVIKDTDELKAATYYSIAEAGIGIVGEDTLQTPWPKFTHWFFYYEKFGSQINARTLDTSKEKSYNVSIKVPTYYYPSTQNNLDNPYPERNSKFAASIFWLDLPGSDDYKIYTRFYVNVCDITSFFSNFLPWKSSQSTYVNTPSLLYDKNHPINNSKINKNSKYSNRISLKTPQGTWIGSTPNEVSSNSYKRYLLEYDEIYNKQYTSYKGWKFIYDPNTGKNTEKIQGVNITTFSLIPNINTSLVYLPNFTGLNYNSTNIPNQRGLFVIPKNNPNTTLYRGYATSMTTIYQYTGASRPDGVNYEEVYYFKPKATDKLFKADGSPNSFSYKGPIFETYAFCEATYYTGTTLFSGPIPKKPFFANDDLNPFKPNPINEDTKPLYPIFQFKKYLNEIFDTTEVTKYLKAIGVS